MMAREILFKAKRIDTGEWVEGYLFKKYYQELPHDRFAIQYKTTGDENEWTPKYMAVEIDESTLCQYTGLTDKNGNKIWENDVLDADEVNSLVRFDEENARFVLDDYGIKGCLMEYGFDENAGGYGFIETNGFDDFMDITEAVEVIGNIFDNPELLGGGE